MAIPVHTLRLVVAALMDGGHFTLASEVIQCAPVDLKAPENQR